VTNKVQDQFFRFIEDESKDPLVLRAGLQKLGADVGKLDRAVSEILAREAAPRAATWLERARSAQAGFEAKLKGKSTWLSSQFKDAQSLLKAITSGELGIPVQQHAQVYFRNESAGEISEKDLRSFLDDCELLSLLDDTPPGGGERES
jgi:hypothetical protein